MTQRKLTMVEGGTPTADTIAWQTATGEHSYSRKHMLAFKAVFEQILSNSFDDRTIRELLMLVRAPLRDNYKTKLADGITAFQLSEADVNLVLDVCDLIAHPRKEKQAVVNLIVETVEQYAMALASGKDDYELPPVAAIDANRLALALMKTATLVGLHYLPAGHQIDGAIQKQAVDPDEVAICILCALQDVVIVPKGHNGTGRLFLADFEGHYRLYCMVSGGLSDKIHGTNTKGLISTGFPVFVSTCPVQDFVNAGFNRLVPGVFEAVRDGDGALTVRTLIAPTQLPDEAGN